MPDKTQLDLLNDLTRQQSRLTLDLTEWLIKHYYRFSETDSSGQAAVLQRWISLLVQSLLESIRTAQPAIMVDFVIVLRAQGHSFFDPTVWRVALHWLGQRCHRILKDRPVWKQTVSLDQNNEAQEDFYCERYELLANLLNQLDYALRYAVRELERRQPVFSSLLKLTEAKYNRDYLRFSLN
jgi:hypothetical protein